MQALPIKDEELILTPDIQSDIGAESDVPKRVSVIADLTPAVECQRLQVLVRDLPLYLMCACIEPIGYLISRERKNYSLLPHDSVPHIYGGPPKEGAQGCENFVLALAFQPCLRNSRNVGPTLVATPEH